jgi:hypothetical protein
VYRVAHGGLHLKGAVIIVRILAAAVASLALASAAFAQSDIRTGDVYDSYAVADLQGMITGLGYTATSLDATSYEVTTSTGFIFYVYGVQCDAVSPKKTGPVGHCQAMEVSSSWSIEPGQLEAVRASAASYDANYVFLKTYVTDDGLLHALRYAITGGGVTWDHLQREISEFTGAVDYFLDTLNTETGADLISPT